jgi:hypothetical protein
MSWMVCLRVFAGLGDHIKNSPAPKVG